MNIKTISLFLLLFSATHMSAMRTQQMVPKQQAIQNWHNAHQDIQKKWLALKNTQEYRQWEHAKAHHTQEQSWHSLQLLQTAVNTVGASKESQSFFQSIDSAENLLRKVPGEQSSYQSAMIQKSP